MLLLAYLKRLAYFLSENVYFSYTGMYSLKVAEVWTKIMRLLNFLDETQTGPTSRRVAMYVCVCVCVWAQEKFQHLIGIIPPPPPSSEQIYTTDSN